MAQYPPPSPSNLMPCPRCGALSPQGTARCSACGAALIKQRPGCVTLYALLAIIGGVGGVIITVAALAVEDIRDELPFDSSLMLVYGVAAVFAWIVGAGLWRMRNWARVLLLINQTVGLGAQVYMLITGNWFALLAMALSVYLIYWFVANRRLFE